MSRGRERRSVVVTGAGSGIGQAICERFVEAGDAVVGIDLDVAGVPDGAVGVAADVSSASEMERAIGFAVDIGRGIDVLCNNAGIGSTHDVLDCSLEEWERVFAVNVRGVFLGTRLALPHFLEQGSGSIVNTASIAGIVGLRDRAAYCASKGAVIALTKQVAVQWANRGIRCNCVCPGTVDSPWVGRLLAESEDAAAQRTQLIARQPLGRLGTPQEVAGAVFYLASDDAAFATGTCLVIDGGIVAG